jgi:hypothetical protein
VILEVLITHEAYDILKRLKAGEHVVVGSRGYRWSGKARRNLLSHICPH